MNGTEFIRRAKRYTRRHGLEFRYVPARGKGSHGLLYVGRRRAVVKHGEISQGMLTGMLKQPGIGKKEF